MRIQRVVARAFGPFQDRSLELAPGMTVIAGPNESGKSSWHAALRLAVTGVRRGKGPGTAAERQLAERHKPWDRPEPWTVEARLQLDDGRLIDIAQDLGAKVACRAVDVALGRDVSDEIMDGTPDASRWLGLDRDAFAATVSVSQAQIMAVADEASALQEQMQRAAATRGTDATAAEAIARLDQFRRDAVGADTVAAKGPLRTAKNRLAAADAALVQARAQHADYLQGAAAVDAAERSATAARRRLAGAEAAQARMQAADFVARAARAAELAARHAGPPPSLAGDEELSGRVTATLQAWATRPRPTPLQGRAAADIEQQIKGLPDAPRGDLEPHPSVSRAHSALQAATQAVGLIGDEPPTASHPAVGWSATQLRDLARRLEDRELPDGVALQEELARLRARDSQRTSRFLVPGLVGVGGVVGALAVFAVGLSVPGAVLLAAALAIAIVTLLLSPGRASPVGDGEALATYREAAGRARQEREAAAQAALESSLPTDPARLLVLADEAVVAEQVAATHAAWEERQAAAARAVDVARDALITALSARAVVLDGSGNALEAATAYMAACQARARQQRDAERRRALTIELAARRRDEEALHIVENRQEQLIGELRELAALVGADRGADPAAIAGALETWRSERAAVLDAAQRALSEWQQLQGLLEGGTLADLQAEAARRRERANELAIGLPPDAITLPMGIEADDHLADLRRQSQALEREHDVARGALHAQRDGLLDVAEAEEGAAITRRELDRVEALARTVDTTLGLLRAAQERVHRDLAPVLAQAVGRWLPIVSAGRYVEASVDPASLAIGVKEAATGQWREARLLSEGTREQIYLLLRVAMAEHLVITGERAPLLLDEVTAQADGDRKREVLAVLHRLSEERQVIVFTHDDDVAAWAEATLRTPQDAVIRLQPLAAMGIQAVTAAPSEQMVAVSVD